MYFKYQTLNMYRYKPLVGGVNTREVEVAQDVVIVRRTTGVAETVVPVNQSQRVAVYQRKPSN